MKSKSKNRIPITVKKSTVALIGCGFLVLVVVGIKINKFKRNKPNDIQITTTDSGQIVESKVIIESEFSNLIFSEFGDYLTVDGIKEPTEIVRIPTSYNGIEVVRISDGAFSNDSVIKELYVERPITFGIGCFDRSTVEKVSIIDEHDVVPEYDTYFGLGAFSFCENLKEFECDAYIKGIADAVFIECGNLEKVTLKCPIEWIPKDTFGSCDNLREVFIPATVTSIDDTAFETCVRLETVSGYNNSYVHEWSLNLGVNWNGVDEL